MGDARELPLLIGAAGKAGETLMLIGAPDASGVVHIRQWSAADWSAPPEARAERAVALLAWIEREAERGRSLNQSLYAVRLWLNGNAAALP